MQPTSFDFRLASPQRIRRLSYSVATPVAPVVAASTPTGVSLTFTLTPAYLPGQPQTETPHMPVGSSSRTALSSGLSASAFSPFSPKRSKRPRDDEQADYSPLSAWASAETSALSASQILGVPCTPSPLARLWAVDADVDANGCLTFGGALTDGLKTPYSPSDDTPSPSPSPTNAAHPIVWEQTSATGPAVPVSLHLFNSSSFWTPGPQHTVSTPFRRYIPRFAGL